MSFPWQPMIWRQFAAAIDSLEEAIRACPEELWRARLWTVAPESTSHSLFRFPEFSEVWYLAYHALFWLDLYLTGSEDGFVPPAPFLLIEQHEDGPVPERPYTRDEVLSYLAYCRERCRTTIAAQTDETAQRLCEFPWGTVPFLELLIYTMRHVQEHAAQLNLTVGQRER
jgi:hypothetical protein